MIEILEFAFRDFETWLGCFVFLFLIAGAVASFRLVTVEVTCQRGKQFYKAKKIQRATTIDEGSK